MGMKDDFVASGETNDEVKKKMWEHAEKAHRDMAANMTDEQKQEMEKKMDELLSKQ